MNLPPEGPLTRRFQLIVLWVRFSRDVSSSLVAFSAFCDRVQGLLLKFELGAVVLQDGDDIVLSVQGIDADIDSFLRSLRISPHLDIVVAWRLSAVGVSYRPRALAKPILTPGERAWVRMEIDSGFSVLENLPGFVEWLAYRQIHPEPTRHSEKLVHRSLPPRKRPSAQIIPFRSKER